MRVAVTLPLAAAVAAATLSFSREASALGPVGVEVGAKVGAATNPTGETFNPLGFGLGARAGVSVFGIYGGLSYMYYFGGSTEVDGLKVTGKSMLYGVEGGYSLDIVGLLTLRPQLGVGVYDGTFRVSTGPASDVSAGAVTVNTAEGKNLYLEPGITAVVPLGFWFAGADANVLLLPGQDGSRAAFTFHGQIGLRF